MSARKAIYRGKVGGSDLVIYERVTRDMDDDNNGIVHRRGGRYFVSVRPGLSVKKRIEIIVHEILHAADWSKDEEWVEETGRDIANALHALGYTDQ